MVVTTFFSFRPFLLLMIILFSFVFSDANGSAVEPENCEDLKPSISAPKESRELARFFALQPEAQIFYLSEIESQERQIIFRRFSDSLRSFDTRMASLDSLDAFIFELSRSEKLPEWSDELIQELKSLEQSLNQKNFFEWSLATQVKDAINQIEYIGRGLRFPSEAGDYMVLETPSESSREVSPSGKSLAKFSRALFKGDEESFSELKQSLMRRDRFSVQVTDKKEVKVYPLAGVKFENGSYSILIFDLESQTYRNLSPKDDSQFLVFKEGSSSSEFPTWLIHPDLRSQIQAEVDVNFEQSE